MADAGIEPDVEDVRLFLEIAPAALRAAGPRRQELLRLPLEPDVGAVLADEPDHVVEDLFGHQLAVAPLAVEHRDRHAPEPLAGDAPVGAVLDHAVDPVAPPGGDPGDAVDRGKRLFPEVVLLHGDEPLLGRAEDDRLLAAPAVGVGVLHIHPPEERARLPELRDDPLVGVEDELPGEVFDVAGEFPVVVDGGVVLQAVFHPDLVVLLAVARGDVDAAGPGVEGDEGGKDEERLALIEGMAAGKPLHDLARETRRGSRGVRCGTRRRPGSSRGDPSRGSGPRP